ncbi:MAG: sugar ABC transporter permease [Chloroflexota bacterium]
MDIGQSRAAPRPRRSLLALLVGAQSPYEARKAVWGYFFLAPWLLGLLVFVGGPIVASFILGFTEYDVLSPARWVGLKNYTQALTGDRLFWPALGKTFYYAVVVVPVGLAGSLLLAILLNQKLKVTNLFRTMFYLPHLTPAVTLSILWLWLMNPEIGPLNYVLRSLGFGKFPWLTDKNTVIPSLIVINLWAGMGGNNMLIFLAGLQGVPVEFFEAADLDGASSWQKFVHVTLPMISPSILFNLTLGIIGALQVFTTAFITTKGGPSYGSWFLALHIYQQAFAYFRMGYASALSWIFVAIVMVLTVLNVRLSDRWVFYGGSV